MEHTVSILCCKCEPLAVTLVRARLWPATAQNPRLAFTFDLLDWAEALMYECQVALKDLWGALQVSSHSQQGMLLCGIRSCMGIC